MAAALDLRPDWTALLPEALDLVCTALCDPKRRAAAPWWLCEGSVYEMIEQRCGLPESAQCQRSHDDDAAAVAVVRDLRRVCRAWRDAIGYTASAIEWLELEFNPTCLEPSEIDWPAFANLKELTLHGEITCLPDGLRSLRALQTLDVQSFHVAKVPSWFAELQLQELRLDFWGPTGLRSPVLKSCTSECLRKDVWLPPSVRRLTVHESAAIVAPERFAQQLEWLVIDEYYLCERQPTSWEYCTLPSRGSLDRGCAICESSKRKSSRW
jgi:hypothetical protein